MILFWYWVVADLGNNRKGHKQWEATIVLILRPKVPKEKDKLCKDVANALKVSNFIDNEDIVKVALALYAEVVVMEKYKKTQFDVKIFGIVDNTKVLDIMADRLSFSEVCWIVWVHFMREEGVVRYKEII